MTEGHRPGAGKTFVLGLVCRRELDELSYPGPEGEAAFVSKWTVSQKEKKSTRNRSGLSVGFRSFA